jgi:hypothetical protein
MRAVFVTVSKEHDAWPVLSYSSSTNERRMSYRKIQLDKDVLDVTTLVDRQGCYILGHMEFPAPSINKPKKRERYITVSELLTLPDITTND